MNILRYMLNTNIPSGYHISKGSESKFFILNDGELYCGKLSTNLDKAKKIAKEKLGFSVPVKIWYRFGIQKTQIYVRNLDQDSHVQDHFAFLNEQENKIRIENKKQELTKKYSTFSHISNVGDKVDLELTITEIFTYPIYTEFSDRAICGYCHKFTDKNNNKLIYFGASKAFVEKYTDEDDIKKEKEIYKVGDKITVKATIKEHTIDKKDVDSETKIGMPLTVITRPKLITEFQADNKIQVSAGKSTNNNPESKTRGENDE